MAASQAGSARCSRPVIVRIALDGLTEFELCWGWSLGKGGRRAFRALHAKKRRNKLSRGSGIPNGGGGDRVCLLYTSPSPRD